LNYSCHIVFFTKNISGFRQLRGEEQKQWLFRELANSQADWRVVLGHHTIYSAGRMGCDAPGNGIALVKMGKIWLFQVQNAWFKRENDD
jgi:hypothetical protein